MLEKKIYQYLHSLHDIPDHLERIKVILKGCTEFFPFKRASIFTYSPISHYGEGILLLENNHFLSMNSIKEEASSIPAIQLAIKNNQPHLITIEPSGKNYPVKYIQQFGLDHSLLVIPISHKQIVIGIVLLDRFTESCSLRDYDYMTIHHYFQEAADFFFNFKEQKRQKTLSRRELEVLQRLSYGYSLKEMATSMGISEFTVRDYLSSVNRKLGTKHRSEAVGVALRSGLIH